MNFKDDYIFILVLSFFSILEKFNKMGVKDSFGLRVLLRLD